MRKTAQTFLTLSTDTHARARKEAQASGKTLSEYVEGILHERWHQSITAEKLLARSEALYKRKEHQYQRIEILSERLKTLIERSEELCQRNAERYGAPLIAFDDDGKKYGS